jgi:acetyl-CoA carboxylase carboxyl transferase subunit alpha
VNLREMMLLKVPIVSVIIGEGGSGGALGIAVADRLLMLENSYYSVISPEGCAAILWKHRAHAQEAAEAMKLTARDLQKLNLIDEVIPEPLGGAHRNHEETAAAVKAALVKHLRELAAKPEDQLLASATQVPPDRGVRRLEKRRGGRNHGNSPIRSCVTRICPSHPGP